MTAPAAPGTLLAALSGALVARAGAVCPPALVAGPRDPLACAVRDAGGPVVAAAGPAVRPALAAGLALAGRPAVAWLGGAAAPVPPAGWPEAEPVRGLVVATTAAACAGAWWGAGATLCQPTWPGDVAPLLDAALEARGPVVLRLPAGPVALPPGVSAPRDRPGLGTPRVLRRGRLGVVAAAGTARVPLLVQVARMLAARGADVTAVELHTTGPADGPGPLVTDTALLVSVGARAEHRAPGGRAGWPAGLTAVAVPDEPRAAMEAVAACLPAVS